MSQNAVRFFRILRELLCQNFRSGKGGCCLVRFFVKSELCTILAMPSSNFTAAITLTVDGANKSTVELPIGTADNTTSYDAGYIYYFTITVNNPQEITIMETGLTEWVPGSNPTEGAEI